MSVSEIVIGSAQCIIEVILLILVLTAKTIDDVSDILSFYEAFVNIVIALMAIVVAFIISSHNRKVKKSEYINNRNMDFYVKASYDLSEALPTDFSEGVKVKDMKNILKTVKYILKCSEICKSDDIWKDIESSTCIVLTEVGIMLFEDHNRVLNEDDYDYINNNVSIINIKLSEMKEKYEKKLYGKT